MLTLVTGACTRYFVQLQDLLNNVINVASTNKIDIRLIVYDLGMKDSEISKLTLLFKNMILVKFDFSKYPEHVSLQKNYGFNCSYAWKPIIIHEVCEKYRGLVHWMDTRTQYYNFKTLIKILHEQYIYSPRSGSSVKRWTHPTTLKYMNNYRFLSAQQRQAGVFAVNYEIDWVRKLVTEWKDLALIKECICPDGSNRSNHRQDQSILSILYYKYQEKYKFKDIIITIPFFRNHARSRVVQNQPDVVRTKHLRLRRRRHRRTAFSTILHFGSQ